MTDPKDSFDMEVDLPAPEGLELTELTTQQPYRILVLADLAGPKDGALSGPLAERIVEVAANTFDETMAAAAPTVRLTLSDPVAPGSVMVALDLRFDSLRAFDPANLAQQIPAARALLAAREPLVARMRGKATPEQMTRAVAAAAADPALAWLTDSVKWSPAKPAAPPEALDSLLGQIDLGAGGPGATPPGAPPPKSPIGAIVSAAAGGGPSIPAEEASAIRRTLAELDRRVSSWLTAVLHAPPVQSLEAVWRSLAFLVSKIDFRKGVKLSVLHAGKLELLARFKALLIDPVFDQGLDAPDLIVVDALFANTAADLEALDEVAQHAASLPAVALAGVGAEFFGVKFAWQIPALPALINHFDQWQFAKYKTLRGQPYASFLGLVVGRCLLRPPHGRQDAPDLEFNYREPCMTDRDLVWACGPIATACTVAHSIADTGWPTGMAGHIHGRIGGLATATGGAKNEKTFGPTDTPLPEPRIGELAAAGLNAVVAPRNSPDAIFWNGLTVARPRRADAQALLEVSLPYQLFAIRLSVLLYALKPQLQDMAAEKMSSFVTQHVQEWLKVDGQAAQVLVQTQPPEDDPTGLQLAVVVTPPARILPAAIPVALGLRVR